MIAIDDILISDDVVEKKFVCDLHACKGMCCVEGVGGPPVEDAEMPLIEQNYEKIKPYMTAEGIAAVEKQGLFVFDEKKGYYKLPLINDGACAFVKEDENGIMLCGMENAHRDGHTDFKKPISCHLYPIRVTKAEELHFLNFDEWKICDPACKLGESLKMPVYQFLKEPLIRKFGEEFYAALDATAKHLEGGNSGIFRKTNC